MTVALVAASISSGVELGVRLWAGVGMRGSSVTG